MEEDKAPGSNRYRTGALYEREFDFSYICYSVYSVVCTGSTELFCFVFVAINISIWLLLLLVGLRSGWLVGIRRLLWSWLYSAPRCRSRVHNGMRSG